MLQILHTIPALDGGGADRILYDYCIRMSDVIHFDFIVHTENQGILEQELQNIGCRIFHIQPLHTNARAYCSNIKNIIKNGKYDIIHVSQGYRGLLMIFYAKKYGIKVRIAHSHMAYIPESIKEHVVRKISTFFVKRYATHLFACGKDAAIWMWGREAYTSGKVHIMTNAIDTERFKYSEEKRDKIRAELRLEDKFVIGNVARFSYQKNHEFLIRVFAEVKKIRKDAVLMLIGRGELEADIKNQVSVLGLNNSVIFMGVRNDVPEILNAIDVFVLPSRYEGLPVTLVEVQANGLPTLVADTVTKEIYINNNVAYLPLNVNCWVGAICRSIKTRINNNSELVKNAGYDITLEALGLLQHYKELHDGTNPQ